MESRTVAMFVTLTLGLGHRLCAGYTTAMEDILKLQFSGDGIARIVMCNGENRFRTSTLRKWNDVLDRVTGNPDVKALIVTGEGKFFSNGIDLDWLKAEEEASRNEFINALHEWITRLLVFPVPTVAVLNGHAFGVAAFLAIACDYRVMRADRGWLCWPEVQLGLVFSETLINIIRAKVPVGPAQMDAIVYAKRLPAQVAQKFGLVDVVTEEAGLEQEGRKLLQTAVGRRGIDRHILQATKKSLYGKGLNFSKL